MAANQGLRPKFYEEQYLGAADLTATVEYGRLQNAQHALGAHTWGIAAGLQLEEKDSSAGGGQVEVFIQPGYAWDGFGRPIVALAPYRIPAELFKSILFDASLPAGQLIKVWLRYDESATQRARSGFEVCDRADQFYRVQETFRVEIGERISHQDRHNPISVAGYLVDAQETLHKPGANDPKLYDESVPYQNFPEAGQPALWLIPLGVVRWQPDPAPNQPGAFAKRILDDFTLSRKLRRYIGVVAEAVEAADGRIRMKRRDTDDSTVVSNDLVWVEGDLRVEGDVRLFSHKLDFRDSGGLDNNGIPLSIQRVDLPGASGSLQVVIGQSDKGANTFAVGPLNGPKFDAKLIVRDDGNVGIGTDAPGFKLDVMDRMRVRQGSAQSAGIWFFQNTPNADRAFVGMATDNQVGFWGATGGRWGLLMDTTSGNVGIGTDAPGFKLDVANRMRVRQGTSPSAGIWFFQNTPNADRAFVGMARDEGVGFWGASGAQWGLVMDTTSGNVGIGTVAPTHKFHCRAGEAVGLFESTGSQAFLQIVTNEGLNNRVEITNRPGGRLSLWTAQTGDVFNITRAGNVGIGTVAPTHKFHCRAGEAVGLFESTGSQAFLQIVTNEGLDNRVEITNRPGGRLSLWTAQTGDVFNITRAGNVGIGTETPIDKLHVIGDLRIMGIARTPGAAWTDTSDLRLKKTVEPLSNALSLLLQLRGIRFEWNEPEKMGNLTGWQMGLIAQEVEPVFPQWVSTGSDGYKELTIRGFEALTIEALRELQGEIEILRTHLEAAVGNQPAASTRPRRKRG